MRRFLVIGLLVTHTAIGCSQPVVSDLLYVTVLQRAAIHAFRIDANTGALNPAKDSPFTSPYPAILSVFVLPDKSHGFLRLLNGVAHFDVASDGGIVSIRDGLSVGGVPIAILSHPLRDYVYVPRNDSVAVYEKAGGAWTQVKDKPTGIDYDQYNDLRGMAIDGAGRYFYTINRRPGSPPSWIHQHQIDPESGQPLKDQIRELGIPMRSPERIKMHPSGAWLYVLGRSLSSKWVLAAYAVGTTGELQPVSESLLDFADEPREFVIDPTGRFLYLANVGADHVRAFAIDMFGALHETGRVRQQAKAIDLAVDCTGRFLYVATAGQVQGYSIQSKSGAPLALSGPPARFETGPDSLSTTTSCTPPSLAALPSPDQVAQLK